MHVSFVTPFSNAVESDLQVCSFINAQPYVGVAAESLRSLLHRDSWQDEFARIVDDRGVLLAAIEGGESAGMSVLERLSAAGELLVQTSAFHTLPRTRCSFAVRFP